MPPRKPKNSEVRSREHLTQLEVEKLIRVTAKMGRYGTRNATMILVAFRHGLRVGELVELRWDQVDLDAGELHVSRLKRGKPSTQPLSGDEMRAFRKLRRESPEGPYVFVTRLGGPMEVSGFGKIVKRAGGLAGLEIDCHPHMLRHACGFALANKGFDTRLIQDYLGHRNIQHTVRYTELSGKRFKGLWDD